MADRVLRDHSEPCKDLGRFKEANGVWGCDEYGCPGGREVTIDAVFDSENAYDKEVIQKMPMTKRCGFPTCQERVAMC